MSLVKTYHEVFDEIAILRNGFIIMVTDEAHFDSMIFLNSLLSEYAKKKPVKVVTMYDVLTSFGQVKLDKISSLSELSIFIGHVRENVREGVIIHHYFPHILVQHGEVNTLKLVEHWLTEIREKPLLEFITLPQNTFPTFEKTLDVTLPGVIRLTVKKENESYTRSFTIYRACKPVYHGTSFPYLVENGKLLIKFGKKFIDKLPITESDKIEQEKHYMLENIKRLRIVLRKLDPKLFTPSEYLIATQLHTMPLMEVKMLFPESFDEILNRIARWVVEGIVELQEESEDIIREEKIHPPTKRIKIALKLPNWLFLKFVKKPHKVPLESLLSLRKIIETTLQIYLPKEEEPLQALKFCEKLSHELSARRTAISHALSLGEDPRGKLNLSYLPKIVSLTLASGFGFRMCETSRIAENVWKVKVKDCFICEDVKSSEPVCHIVSGTINGVLPVMFKESFSCEEVECKAMGHPVCAFIVRRM
ncbi:MAG: V4R domain-containing protein [Candidatus Bathyarchaeota archaeon]